MSVHLGGGAFAARRMPSNDADLRTIHIQDRSVTVRRLAEPYWTVGTCSHSDSGTETRLAVGVGPVLVSSAGCSLRAHPACSVVIPVAGVEPVRLRLRPPRVVAELAV